MTPTSVLHESLATSLATYLITKNGKEEMDSKKQQRKNQQGLVTNCIGSIRVANFFKVKDGSQFYTAE